MECLRCHHTNSASDRFCVECGASLSPACPACGEAVQASQKFCGACGHRLSEPAPAPDAVSDPAPQDYTPRHLAQRILTSRSAMEGERKQVTILFADIRGSTELIAGLDPEQTIRRLEPGIQAMLNAVHRHEGTVNQMLGDGIMALFGAPIAHEDHAVRACFAALEMQQAVAKDLTSNIAIRVGLHSGEVMVRSIGNDLSMDYNAVGPTVHLAARMEQLAEPGTIRLTNSTYRLAEDFIEARPLGPSSVKGLTERIELYELTSASTNLTRWESRVSRGLTKFVGRETEMSSLRRALNRAAGGRGPVVAVVGDAGMGKSRLIHEFLNSPELEDWRVLQAAGAPHGQSTVYLPVSNLLRSCFDVEDRDSQSTIVGKVHQTLADMDETMLALLPPLHALLDLPISDPDWISLYPPERRRRTIEAIKSIVLRLAEIRPLVLVIEDLHWIDAETESMLDSLVNSLGTARMMMLITHRPGYLHNWDSKSYYTRILIDPIEDSTAKEFLKDLLGSDASLKDLKKHLIGRAEGTPLFLEEIVRSLAETGALQGTRGSYRLVKDVEEIEEIPPTVQAVLAARIDRLPPEHKDLLQIASVIRQNVPVAWLEAITDLPRDLLNERLSELQAFEFMHESRRVPDLEYTFKHILTHDVAYRSISLDRRRSLHAAVLATIERSYSERLDEQAEQLAHHASRGEIWDKAVTYYRLAGNKAMDRSAYREAIVFYEEALATLGRLPEEPETIQQAIDLRLCLRMALGPTEQFDRIIEYLREAEHLAKALGDKLRAAAINVSLANVLNIQGNYRGAIDAGLAARDAAQGLNDLTVSIGTSFVLGQAYTYSGDYRKALDHFLEHMDDLKGELRHDQFGTTGSSAVDCLSNIALSYAQLGNFSDAIAAAQDATRIAQESKRPFDLAVAYVEYGTVLLWKGDLDDSIPLLEEALDICQRSEIRQLYPNLAAQLGYGYALQGRYADARTLIDRALIETKDMHLRFFEACARIYQTLERFLSGSPEKALVLGRETLAFIEEDNYRALMVQAQRLLGEIYASAGPRQFQKAESYLTAAITHAEELGIQPELAHSCRSLGELYAQNGRFGEARDEIEAARALYAHFGMTYWTSKSEALLAGLKGVPEVIRPAAKGGVD